VVPVLGTRLGIWGKKSLVLHMVDKLFTVTLLTVTVKAGLCNTVCSLSLSLFFFFLLFSPPLPFPTDLRRPHVTLEVAPSLLEEGVDPHPPLKRNMYPTTKGQRR